MDVLNSIIEYRRFLKRRNYSPYTVRNHMNNLKLFFAWLQIPVEQVSFQDIGLYIETLLDTRKHPKTINCHLVSIRGYYSFLQYEKEIPIKNPVKKGCLLRLPKPLPCHLKDEEVARLFACITNKRDKAMFMIMLRCGLRVAEVAALKSAAIDMKKQKLYVKNGKGNKDRVVFLSRDALAALDDYLKSRTYSKSKHIFLTEKGQHQGQPISVRGIQKRMEYYTRKASITASCHYLRHTMATQMLNADADLSTIQDLLGHSKITTTQRYCKVSNVKVERDYYRAMERVQQKACGERETI